MQLQELIPIIFERFSAFQTLWNLYITIVLGIIGFVASAKSALSFKFVRTVVIIGFIAFAVVNLRALDSVHNQREILINLVSEQVESEQVESEDDKSIQKLVEAGRPDAAWQLWAFHLAADLIVVWLIWFVPIYKENRKQSN